MLTKKTTKNQLTLPKDIVKEFPGIEYFDAVVEKRRIVLTPVLMMPADGSIGEIREKAAAFETSGKENRKDESWPGRKREKRQPT
jgi:hypothetical protein